jgi:hypothetical protein
MDQVIELAVSRALMAAALVERALHDSGPWTFAWGDERFEVPAQRTITRDGVVFSAVFPEHCWLAEPEHRLILKCGGEIMLVREQHGIGDGAFEVTLRFRVEDSLV